MTRKTSMVASAFLLLVACSSGGDDAMKTAEAAHRFGWIHAIAPYNTKLPVSEPLGHAPDTLAGHSLRDIINDANVRVRGDARACVDCHDWAKSVDRATFCAEHEPAFQTMPTAKGDGKDPPNAKPQILKDLFADWRAKGCPD